MRHHQHEPVAAIIQAVSAASICAGVGFGERVREARSSRAGTMRACDDARVSLHGRPPGVEDVPRVAIAVPALDRKLVFVSAALERVDVGLAGADAHRLIDRGDENLAVADLAGLGGRRRSLRRPCRRDRIGTATSIRILGRKFTAYSAPR